MEWLPLLIAEGSAGMACSLHSALAFGPRLPPEPFSAVRLRMMLEGCKWDAQLGDQSTLADFPLLLHPATWEHLRRSAERLAEETLRAEAALVGRRDLHAALGLTRQEVPELAPPRPQDRLLRFDFHPTERGWRLSEVNSDVPGGFAESSLLSALLATPERPACGDPAGRWVARLAQAAGGQPVALLCAPGFLEDLQVVSFLQRRLHSLGVTALVATLEQLQWGPDGACSQAGPVGAILRFYQAEWLTRTPVLQPTGTPVLNPGSALLTESKRLPLTFARLGGRFPAWAELAGEFLEPDRVDLDDPGWVFKLAYSNTGDTVTGAGMGRAERWRDLRGWILREPGRWVAQRRFETRPLDTPAGPRYLCLGVYTLGGEAVGAYARLAPTPLVDGQSLDAAVLLADGQDGGLAPAAESMASRRGAVAGRLAAHSPGAELLDLNAGQPA